MQSLYISILISHSMTEALLLLFTGCVGLITTIIMATSYKSNPVFNIFLMLIFITTSIRFLIQGSSMLGLQSLITGNSFSIIYLHIVPSFYLYYRNMVDREKSFHVKDLKHYVFIVCYYLAHTIPAIKNSGLFYYDVTDFIIITVFVLFYSWIGFHLLSNQLWKKKNLQMSVKHYNLIKNWTLFLFTFNIMAATVFLTSIYLELTSGPVSGHHILIYYVICWIFFYSKILISPEILFGLPVLNKKLLLFNTALTKVNESTIEVNDNWALSIQPQKNGRDMRLQENINQNILTYTNGLDRLNHTVNIFRNSKISLNDIANEIGVPISHLMYLFKYHSKVSFSDYRMHSRIQDAINLIENGFLKVNTLESLSSKIGFSSYSPFFKAFQKVSGLSPQEHIKKMKALKIKIQT